MKTAHTKGPWVVHHIGRYPEVSTQNGMETIANPVNGLANAHLIAAAPDLLEALRECITEDGATAERSHTTALQRLHAINQIASAAITKATGGEK